MKKLLTLLALCTATTFAVAQTTMNIYQSNGSVLQIPLSSIDSITYTIGTPGQLATLTTLPVGNIANTSATSGGNITNNGGAAVTQRGVVWSTSPNPTTANNQSSDGSGTGNYTSNLTGLTANTTYYVRAYATNSAGTAYGNQLNFTTTGGGGGIVSNPGAGVTYGGVNYPTVVLGNGQEWMAQNLRTTQYNDGTAITLVTDNAQWYANYNNGTTVPMMSWYNNDQATYTANTFGALYNWYAVSPTTNGNRNMCPLGWHVPTDAEYTLLTDYLGGESVAGGKMKSTGTQYWQSPNTAATNESGFSGLPGGDRSSFGEFNNIGGRGGWWSSSEYSTGGGAWGRYLFYFNGTASRIFSIKTDGFSVRCLRD